MYRLSWLIVYVVMVSAVTLVITLMSWLSSVFINCNVVVLFLLLFLYGLTMILISFLATPLFSKAELAGNVVPIVVMVAGCVYMAVVISRDFSNRDGPVSAVPPWCQWLLSLMSPVAFTLALDQVSGSFPSTYFQKDF